MPSPKKVAAVAAAAAAAAAPEVRQTRRTGKKSTSPSPAAAAAAEMDSPSSKGRRKTSKKTHSPRAVETVETSGITVTNPSFGVVGTYTAEIILKTSTSQIWPCNIANSGNKGLLWLVEPGSHFGVFIYIIFFNKTDDKGKIFMEFNNSPVVKGIKDELLSFISTYNYSKLGEGYLMKQSGLDEINKNNIHMSVCLMDDWNNGPYSNELGEITMFKPQNRDSVIASQQNISI